MAFDFLSSLDTTTMFLLLIIFILFVLSMKRVFSIIKNAIFIAVASILFPVVMNSFFGFNIPTDTDSIVSFILLGLGLYFIYMLGKSVYKVLKLGEGVAKKVVPKIERGKKKDDKQDNKKDDDDEYEEREKELDKREKELRQQEKEVRFRSAIGASKPKKKNADDDYVELKDTESKPKKSSHVEPLPVIDHKKLKRKSRSGHDD